MRSMDGTCQASQKLKNILKYEARYVENGSPWLGLPLPLVYSRLNIEKMMINPALIMQIILILIIDSLDNVIVWKNHYREYRQFETVVYCPSLVSKRRGKVTKKWYKYNFCFWLSAFQFFPLSLFTFCFQKSCCFSLKTFNFSITFQLCGKQPFPKISSGRKWKIVVTLS